ncbi:hypothetical protein Tco_1141594 [Tanacetum coccineum]
MTLVNQDLFYLKYGNSGPKKYTLSLHKYPAVPFPKDDIEERTSRWTTDKLGCWDHCLSLSEALSSEKEFMIFS